MASLHLTRYPGLVSRAKTSTARGPGATGKGVGVLHMGGGFVQYARPLASRSPPSWSGAARERRPGLSRRRTTARRLRGNRKGPGRSQAAGGEGARPHHQDLTRPRGVEHVSSSVSTALTSAVPPSKCPAGIVGIPRILPGLRRRCGVDVSAMDTSAPPDRCQRPDPQPAVGPARLDALDGGMGGARAVGAEPARGGRPLGPGPEPRQDSVRTPPSAPAYLVGVRPRVR